MMKNIKIKKPGIILGVFFAVSLLFSLQPHVTFAVCQDGKYQGTARQCSTGTLSSGSRCDKVCVLQAQLKSRGWYAGEVNGEFSSITAQAVQGYQTAWNRLNSGDPVQVNGAADSATLEAIYTGYPTVSEANQPAKSGLPSGDGPVKTGDLPNGKGPVAGTIKCPDETAEDPVSHICLPKNPYSGTNSIAGQETIAGLIALVLQYLLTFSGIIAVVALVLGGFWYITSAGNEETAEKGRKAIVSAIIGLVVIVLAYAIVTIIAKTLSTPASQIMTTK